MKNALYLCLLLLFVITTACEQTPIDEPEPVGSALPVCIQDIVDDKTLAASLGTIKAQTVDNELHYWLNTGANAYDGNEFIVNGQCDTVCVQAGWFPRECISSYDGENWEIIWEQ